MTTRTITLTDADVAVLQAVRRCDRRRRRAPGG